VNEHEDFPPEIAAEPRAGTLYANLSHRRRIVLGSILISFALVFAYVIWLDVVISSQFEGRRWNVPTQVFARPLELSPGLLLSAKGVEQELTRLGYRASRSEQPGT
jgi:penicillin-binding protein 1B